MQFDLSKAKFIKGKGGGLRKPMSTYFMVADLETSHDYVPNSNNTKDFHVWSYQQGAALFDSETGICIEYEETREITDFVINFLRFSKELQSKKARGIVFFHNLKFDIRFFRSLIIEAFSAAYPNKVIGQPVTENGLYEDFMTDNNTWLYFRIYNLEFRCSWRLTGQSLYSFTKDMNVIHRKLLGANDYGKHYPDEILNQDFIDYMKNDVLGLGEALCQLMKLEKLTLVTLPYTATGFPRNDVKKAFRSNKKEIEKFVKSKPVPKEFRTWALSYAGGQTQVNRLYEGKLVEANKEFSIKHRDFVSFYPSLICTQKFPVGMSDVLDLDDDPYKAAEQLKDIVYSNEYLIFAKVSIVDFKMNDNVMPFIPQSHVKDEKKIQEIYYSHKLQAYRGIFNLYTCTPELKMIYEYAKTKLVVPLAVYIYEAGKMPKPIVDTTMKYFEDKTVYKNKVKKAEENQSNDLLELQSLLQRSKGKLNGIYGMLCEMPIKDKYSITEEGEVKTEHVDITDLKNISNMLDEYYGIGGEAGTCKNGKCFSYSLGVYVTAWAKYFLYKYCSTIGWENVLYVDTDSAFYKSTEEVEKRIEQLNDVLRQEAINNKAYIDIDGKRSYLHYFDDEEEDIKMFKALNAKRYMYYGFNKKGKTIFKLTCAGVTAGTGLHEDENGNAVYDYTREMEICDLTENRTLTLEDITLGFNNFNNDTKRRFIKCGGTIAKYITYSPKEITIDGHFIVTEGGIAIVGTEKELRGITGYKLTEFGEHIFDDFDELTDIEYASIAQEYKLNKLEEKL